MAIVSRFGIEVVIGDIDKYGANITASIPKDNVFSETEEFVSTHNIGSFIMNLENANTREEFAKASKVVNELCVFHEINEPKVMDMIITGVNMALVPTEKEMCAFGENRGGLEDFELEYSDISDELHRFSAKLDYSEIKDYTPYKLARAICEKFMDCMFRGSTSLPYNPSLHQNWNYEYGEK